MALRSRSAAQEGICHFLLILTYLKRCNVCKCTEIHENEMHYRSVRVIHGVPQCALDNMMNLFKGSNRDDNSLISFNILMPLLWCL